MSRIAFDLNPDDEDYELITRAFRDAQLDPKEEGHWRELVFALAEAKYGSPGAPTKWTTVRSFELLRDLLQIKSRTPNLREKDICERLLKEHPEKYPVGVAAGTLKRQISEARKMLAEYMADLPVMGEMPKLSDEQQLQLVNYLLEVYRAVETPPGESQ